MLTTLAAVPAILAVINLVKSVGLPSRWAPIVAVFLGVAFNVAEGAFADNFWYGLIRGGLILGLGAAGLYDTAKIAGATVFGGSPTTVVGESPKVVAADVGIVPDEGPSDGR